ncbi:hypothetical protein LCGC14_0409320 [marine sediment metagenome]|uniref:Uncharacterized protein n=1 Tax=marine sediment metagenome TaxID=412755 RepID=A0A0F9TCD9_9ZZZZ
MGTLVKHTTPTDAVSGGGGLSQGVERLLGDGAGRCQTPDFLGSEWRGTQDRGKFEACHGFPAAVIEDQEIE